MEQLGRLVYSVGLSLMLAASLAPGFQLVWGWFITPAFGLTVPVFELMMGLIIVLKMLALLVERMELEDVPLTLITVKVVVKIILMWIMVGIAGIVHVMSV